MQFKYFSEAWCRGGTVRREKPKDALREQEWGTGVGTSKTHPSPGQPQVCTVLHSVTLLMRCFEKLRAPLQCDK